MTSWEKMAGQFFFLIFDKNINEWSLIGKFKIRNSAIQSNLGLTDKCGPTTVRCWKKSVKRKRSVPHSVTIVCTSTANIAYHNASKRGIIMSLRQRSTISRFVGY